MFGHQKMLGRCLKEQSEALPMTLGDSWEVLISNKENREGRV